MFAMFEKLLKETMGLDASTIGAAALERAIRIRQDACGLADASAYWDLTRQGGNELQELIEAVIVPETWFFREQGALAALVDFVHTAWMPAHREAALRVLSLPCSTGEEPYSIAMALHDAGVPPERYRIDAIDISERAIDKARGRIYQRHSFRQSEVGYRDRHFSCVAQGYQLCEQIGRQVHFKRHNVLAPDFPGAPSAYDVVFCRNMLIYFDRATQDRTLGLLSGLLAPEGRLFVGACETGLLHRQGFVAEKRRQSFAFRKVNPSREPDPLPPPPPVSTASVTVLRRRIGQAPSGLPPMDQAASPKRAESQPSSLEQAVELADQGRLGEAAEAVQAHMQRHGPSAEALHLLALVRDAQGLADEALACYRKVLYLAPEHDEALAHLGCLLEKRGDHAGAAVVRARHRRASSKRSAR